MQKVFRNPLVLMPEEISGGTLIVDDISDTGETLLLLEKKLSVQSRVVTLFRHKNTKRMPDFAVHEKKEWVVFPWETEASSRYDSPFVTMIRKQRLHDEIACLKDKIKEKTKECGKAASEGGGVA